MFYLFMPHRAVIGFFSDYLETEERTECLSWVKNGLNKRKPQWHFIYRSLHKANARVVLPTPPMPCTPTTNTSESSILFKFQIFFSNHSTNQTLLAHYSYKEPHQWLHQTYHLHSFVEGSWHCNGGHWSPWTHVWRSFHASCAHPWPQLDRCENSSPLLCTRYWRKPQSPSPAAGSVRHNWGCETHFHVLQKVLMSCL